MMAQLVSPAFQGQASPTSGYGIANDRAGPKRYPHAFDLGHGLVPPSVGSFKNVAARKREPAEDGVRQGALALAEPAKPQSQTARASQVAPSPASAGSSKSLSSRY